MTLDSNEQFGPVEQVKLNDMPGSDRKHNYRMIIITVIVVLIAIGGFIVSQNENLQQSMKRALSLGGKPGESSADQLPVTIQESVIADPKLAWVQVEPQKPSYSTNETVTLQIKAFSEGKDITGYDLLIKLNPDMYSLKSIASALTGFTVFPFEKGTYIAVTGIKDLGTSEQTVFNDTPILNVELTPKRKGSSVIGVSLTEGKEKTQLIDADVNVLVPQIGTAKVEIN